MGIGDLLSRQAVGVRATAPNKRQLLHGLADLAAPALGVPAAAVTIAYGESGTAKITRDDAVVFSR